MRSKRKGRDNVPSGSSGRDRLRRRSGRSLPVGPARFRGDLGMLNQLGDIRNLPKPISNASGHRRGDAKRLMDADEIVIHHMERDGVGVVLDLL